MPVKKQDFPLFWRKNICHKTRSCGPHFESLNEIVCSSNMPCNTSKERNLSFSLNSLLFKGFSSRGFSKNPHFGGFLIGKQTGKIYMGPSYPLRERLPLESLKIRQCNGCYFWKCSSKETSWDTRYLDMTKHFWTRIRKPLLNVYAGNHWRKYPKYQSKLLIDVNYLNKQISDNNLCAGCAKMKSTFLAAN